MIIFTILVFYSCGGNVKEKNKEEIIAKYKDSKYALAQAKKILGNNVKFAYSGKFDSGQGLEVAAGTEIKNSNKLGIRFYLLNLQGDNLVTSFQTKILNGSFQQCLIQKIKFPWFDHELIYYNSQDFFMGSGGGEIISYVINFTSKEVYYAHLIVRKNIPVSLYLSNNIKIPGLKSFFISNFKRDFPKLALIQDDMSINN